MLNRNILVFGLASAMWTAAFADSVVILPGASNTAAHAQIYAADPFALDKALENTPAGAFHMIAKPDGTKYYLIANSGGTGVSVVDPSFTTVRSIGGAISTAPSLAAITPDGSRLLVVAGNRIYTFDTGNDTMMGSGLAFTGAPKDIAFAIDSKKAFLLANDNTTGNIIPIDLTANTVGAQAPLDTFGISLSVAPNGLLYATMANRVQEYDPGTLQKRPAGAIVISGLPQKPVFTPDGKFALSINGQQSPSALIYEFDLVKRSLAGVVSAANVQDNDAEFTNLYVASDKRIFAYSAPTFSLYEIQPGSTEQLTATRTALQGVLPYDSIGALALSNENPARFAYLVADVSGDLVLLKANLTTNKLADPGRQAIAEFDEWLDQKLEYQAVSNGAAPASVIAITPPQSLRPGAASAPLVVRVVDAQGRPVMGTRVDFTTAAAGAVLNPVTAFTNADGYAQSVLTAPGAAGDVAVSASAAGVTKAATLTATVTAGGGGCTTGCTASTMDIISGNGLLLGEGFQSPELLMVEVKDEQGEPVAGETVTFLITSGLGSFQCPVVGGTNYPYIPTGQCSGAGSTSASMVTDDRGRAGVIFASSYVPDPNAFQESVVQATSRAGTVTFHETTYVTIVRDERPVFPPAAYLVQPDLRVLQGGAGQILPGAVRVQVTSQSGPGTTGRTTMANVGVEVGPAPGSSVSASCAGGVQLTDASGVANCDVQIGDTLGQGLIRVTIGGAYLYDIALTVTQGPAAKIQISSPANGTASGAPGAQIPLQISVTDMAGSPSSNVALAWTVTPPSAATLTSASTATDSSGAGRATLTLGNTPGALAVKVTAGAGASAPSATFNITISAPVGTFTIVSGDNQTAATGAAFAQPLVVQVNNASNQPASGVVVNFAVTSGLATLSSTTATTAANGQASVTATAGATAGPIVITATAGGQSVTFHLTSTPPGPAITADNFRNAASGAAGLTPCGIAILSAPGVVPGIQGTLTATKFVGGLPTTFTSGGYSVMIRVGEAASPIYWVSNTADGGEQIAFQTPCEAKPGNATVTVTVNGAPVDIPNVPVAKYQPGLFETDFNGLRFGTLLHADPNFPDLVGTTVTPQNPARRGELITMFATGLGSVTPATGTNRAGIGAQTVDANVIVGVNNAGVRVVSAEYLPGQVGLYAITFQVPEDTQPGPRQNLALVVTDPTDPNATFIYANGSFITIAE
jgi:uncharacterized protein (TIGR03437 family)